MTADQSKSWKRSEDGKALYDNCFESDVILRVSGDFASDADRVAYVDRLLDLLNAQPKTKKQEHAEKASHDCLANKVPDECSGQATPIWRCGICGSHLGGR